MWDTKDLPEGYVQARTIDTEGCAPVAYQPGPPAQRARAGAGIDADDLLAGSSTDTGDLGEDCSQVQTIDTADLLAAPSIGLAGRSPDLAVEHDLPTRDFVLLEGIFEADDEQEWQERALCAQTDPEAFFPEKGGSTREAKRICQGCEVRADCLEYALSHDERFGIWGGLSERERRKLKKRAV